MTAQEEAVVSLLILWMFLLIPLLVILRLGGFPEGIYRILRIKYFAFVIFDADNSPRRRVKKITELTIKSPEHFSFGGRTFYTDSNNTARTRNTPTWYYHRDNAIPIPVITGVIDEKKFDPITINKAYRIDIERRIMNLRKESRTSILRIAMYAVFAMIALFVIMVMVA